MGLIDADGDGRFGDHAVSAVQPDLHGIWIEGDTALLATIREVFTAPILGDGSFSDLTPIVEGLPDGGQHPNRLSVGSTCNACEGTSEESAAMLRAQADGSGHAVFASGLRNAIGFGRHPETGALWGMDHGIDWLGDEEQNQIEEGKGYGWPCVHGMDEPNPQDNPPEGEALAFWAGRSEEPAISAAG